MTSADPDQILVIECDQGIVERRRMIVRRGRDDVLDSDRPTSLEEGPQDEPDKRLLASRRRAACRSSGSRALSSSAVRITRFAKLALLSRLG